VVVLDQPLRLIGHTGKPTVEWRDFRVRDHCAVAREQLVAEDRCERVGIGLVGLRSFHADQVLPKRVPILGRELPHDGLSQLRRGRVRIFGAQVADPPPGGIQGEHPPALPDGRLARGWIGMAVELNIGAVTARVAADMDSGGKANPRPILVVEV